MSTEVKSPSQAPFSPDDAKRAYNQVVEHAQLSSIQLISNSFFVKPGYFSTTNLKSRRNSFNHTFVDVHYNSELKILGGQINWMVEVKQSRTKLLSVDSTYLVAYVNVPDVGDAHSHAFFTRVGKFATFPYFRALVSRLVAEADADLPILPVLK